MIITDQEVFFSGLIVSGVFTTGIVLVLLQIKKIL